MLSQKQPCQLRSRQVRDLSATIRTLLLLAFAPFVSPSTVLAQYYDTYADEGPPLLEKIMTSPAASLILVLAGCYGMFLLFFATGKGERSDRQQMVGVVFVIAVIVMFFYRCSLWNDESQR